MSAGAQRVAGGAYAERDAVPRSALDRALAALGYHLHNGFARARAIDAGFAARVAAQSEALASEALAGEVRALRRALRLEGPRAALLARGFALFSAARRQLGGAAPGAQSLAAARLLVHGGRVVELTDAGVRRDALALAAAINALRWNAVHVVSASDALARAVADAIQAPLGRLGIDVGCVLRGMDAPTRIAEYGCAVVCVAQRELTVDYLRDRLHGAGRAGRLVRTVAALSGDAARGAQRLAAGLPCALVDDVDALLLDEARMPVVLYGEDSLTRQRLLYEQALALARALTPARDFIVGEAGAQLTDAGAQWIERLTGTLGGLWGIRQRREALVNEALTVLHVLERQRDYRVEQGRVVYLPAEEEDADEPAAQSADRQWLTELKEGCRLSARRDVLARVSVPGFYRRYLQLGGVSADVRGAEDDLWKLYGLKSTRFGSLPAPVHWNARVLARRGDKLEVVRAAAASIGETGAALVVALRSAEEAERVRAALAEHGLEPAVLTGAGDAAEQGVLGSLEIPGTVALSVYPAGRTALPAAAGNAAIRLIVAEMHDSARQVERLCRAYGVTAYELVLSLEDEAVSLAARAAARALARAVSSGSGRLPTPLARWFVRHAQRRLERIVVMLRQEVRLRDEQLDDLLAFSGAPD